MEGFRQKVQGTIETETIKNLGLKLVGIGAEKVVFETPGSTRKIIKINTDYLLQKVASLLGFRDFSPEQADSSLKEMAQERDNIYKDVSEIFGEKHLLRSGRLKTKIPLTKDLIAKIFEGDKTAEEAVAKLEDGKVYEIEVIVETQLVAEELKDPELSQTQDIHTCLMRATDFYKSKDIPEALAKVRKLIDENFLADFDESFEDKYLGVLREIITNVIRYTKRTGRMIDIFGPNNITIFTQEDGSINYHMLDVVLPGHQGYWEENIREDHSLNLLRHSYTFYYSIARLADKLGLEENLEPEDLNYFKGVGVPKEGIFPEKSQQ